MTSGIITLTTCGAVCWYAREVACRCSCGGQNHGRLLVAGREQPRRNATIQASRYVLGAIDLPRTVRNIGAAFLRVVAADRSATGIGGGGVLLNGRGSAAWERNATLSQLSGWAEVTAWAEQQLVGEREAHVEAIARANAAGDTRRLNYLLNAEPKLRRPALLWVRADLADTFDEYARTVKGDE